MATPPSATLPSVTVTLDDLSLVLNGMGLTGSVSAAEFLNRLQTTHDLTIPMAPNLIPVDLKALQAALANLNLIKDITATQLLDAIKKEEGNHSTFPNPDTP